MSKLLILRGIPGSGKTTFAKQLIEDNSNYVRVNLDDIRAMCGHTDWNRKLEDVYFKTQTSFVYNALNKGFNVVLDNTNMNNKKINVMLDMLDLVLKENNVEIEYKDFFDVPVEICIERDSKRENPVSEKVIRNFYERIPKEQTSSNS